ncbi:hypothetical protein BJ684DRAFT_16561 [Piptocephalis cylindrospora]|uniref:Uncharacterized protein n=1 Tax=Piptocephalis cylindrospora TaxID=1907219 RepID=A0A4P9Y2A1_9FUNG|nr:hypothetical protein BJ684DRAFT_16561 [Piptocephalis cylindrospora]|eukprot:RKP12998.1 hypothetical protein BJ684DRAFT_16561 [Piptocephalis cylindrospora]
MKLRWLAAQSHPNHQAPLLLLPLSHISLTLRHVWGREEGLKREHPSLGALAKYGAEGSDRSNHKQVPDGLHQIAGKKNQLVILLWNKKKSGTGTNIFSHTPTPQDRKDGSIA